MKWHFPHAPQTPRSKQRNVTGNQNNMSCPLVFSAICLRCARCSRVSHGWTSEMTWNTRRTVGGTKKMRFKQSGSTRSLFLKTFEKRIIWVSCWFGARIGKFGEDPSIKINQVDSSRDVNVTNDRTSRRRSRIYARIRWIRVMDTATSPKKVTRDPHWVLYAMVMR